MRRPLVLAGVLATIALAGCVGGDPSPSPSEISLPALPELTDSVGVTGDATFSECSLDAGETTVEGTVTNTSDETADFLVIYSWVDDDNTVLARGSAAVADVEAGAEAEWSLTATVPAGATDCAPLVQRGELAED